MVIRGTGLGGIVNWLRTILASKALSFGHRPFDTERKLFALWAVIRHLSPQRNTQAYSRIGQLDG